MKINLTIIAALTLLFFVGCGKSDKEKSREELKKELKEEKEKDAGEEQKGSSEQLSKATQEKEAGNKTIKAQFEMMVANTSGTFVVFKDKEGESTWYRTTKEADELDFAVTLRPGDKNNKYNGKWYELTYEVRTEERAGDKQKRPYILKAKPISAPPKPPKWNAQTLKKLKFFGSEPNWTLVLKETHAEYTPMGEETKRIVFDQAPSKDKSTLSAHTKDNQNDILEVSGNLFGSVPVKIMIKKESCSDGMSDNTYPYAARLEFEDKKAYEGCGRLVE